VVVERRLGAMYGRSVYLVPRQVLVELCVCNPVLEQMGRLLTHLWAVVVDPDSVAHYSRVLDVVPWTPGSALYALAQTSSIAVDDYVLLQEVSVILLRLCRAWYCLSSSCSWCCVYSSTSWISGF
jgi:hypothetical protein